MLAKRSCCLIAHCVAWAQDARAVLAEARELRFALEESRAAAEHLQAELAAAQVRLHAGTCARCPVTHLHVA